MCFALTCVRALLGGAAANAGGIKERHSLESFRLQCVAQHMAKGPVLRRWQGPYMLLGVGWAGLGVYGFLRRAC